MNNKRRSTIASIIHDVNRASDILNDVISDETYAYNNLPESIQECDRGIRMENVIDLLDRASDCLDDAVDLLNEASE